MKIVQLHAENFKRLGVVEINPEGHVVTIGGKNGHGKSSVLDAIFVALKGRAVAPPQPIRKGAEKCTIRLDMGDLVVSRNFHQKDGGEYTDTRKFESSDGLRYQKSQQVLDALLGEIGFDPFEFVNLKPKDQVARLLQMVPLSIDLDEFRDADASDMQKRRDVGRDGNALKAQVEAIPVEEVPEEAPDRDALVEALGNAADTNSAIERERARREREAKALSDQRDISQSWIDKAAELRRQADDAEERGKAAMQEVEKAASELEALPPLDEPVDTDAIREQLREAEAVLALIDRQARRFALIEQYKAKKAEYDGYTEAMANRAAERNKALAEAEMPVPGLAFVIDEAGEATLTWEGLPFDKDQISTAVQLRVSTAIGMAANPRLRVLRITDGSLLDEDSMKMLAEMAEAEDFQLWVEVVGTGGVGIIMENGEIKGAPEPEPEPEQDTATQGESKPAAKPKGKAKAKPEGGLL